MNISIMQKAGSIMIQYHDYRLQEDKMVFDLNLEIQFLLKQGQVEVDMGKFIPNFSDSVLVHRSCIEELNSHIKVRLSRFISFKNVCLRFG